METNKQIEVVDQIVNQNQTDENLAQDLSTAVEILSDALGSFRSRLQSLLSTDVKPVAATPPKRMARGTDAPAPTPKAVPVRRRTLGELLAEGPADESLLIKSTGSEASKLQAELRALRKGRRVANFGGESPIWVRRLGNDATIPELAEMIQKMLTLKHSQERKSLTLRELCDATGGREGRVSAALVTLKKNGVPIVNIGRPRKAEWSLGTK